MNETHVSVDDVFFIVGEDEFCFCLIFSHCIFLLSVLGELVTQELRLGPSI